MCVPQVAEAKKDGNVLRYAATLEGGTCKVGLTVVSANSPLGRLSGTANLVEFLTEFYSPNPLVIQVRARSHTHSELVSCACVDFAWALCVRFACFVRPCCRCCWRVSCGWGLSRLCNFQGAGAGQFQTASGVLSDLVEMAFVSPV
jgi:hypothetical protein